MPMQNVDLVKETAFSPRWPANIKKRHSTTLSRTPFRHLTQFQLNNPAGGPMARSGARADDGSSEGSRAREAEQQLLHSSAQFAILVQSIKDYAIYMLDKAGRVMSWNTGAERIKGYTRDEIIGQHFSRFYTDFDRKSRTSNKSPS